MLKNILWMSGGLALGLAIWAVYDQYQKAQAKKKAKEAAEQLPTKETPQINTAPGATVTPVTDSTATAARY